MGRELRGITIKGTVSKHNSPQDDIDNALWLLLMAEINKVVVDPKYQSIDIDMGPIT